MLRFIVINHNSSVSYYHSRCVWVFWSN